MKFSVSGEYVTEKARSLYWEDNILYEEAIEFLLGFLGCDLPEDEVKKIAHNILEGRSKLVGINEFDLVDDNKNIREITNKDLHRELIIDAIRKDMRICPRKYVDYYAMNKSWMFCSDNSSVDDVYQYAYTDMVHIYRLLRGKEINSYVGAGGIVNYRLDEPLDLSYYYDDTNKSFLDNGVYLLEQPEIVYELIGGILHKGNITEFYKKLYEYWKNSEHKDNEEVVRRQKLYERKQELYTYLRTKNYDTPKTEEEDITPYDEFSGKPDTEFLSKYGIIDRDGRWYNVNFGHHGLRASYIIEQNPSLFPDVDLNTLNVHNALDIIVKRGFVLLREIGSNKTYIYAKKAMNEYQKNTIMHYQDHFDIDYLEENTFYYE